MSDWNANIIEEFRANEGHVGGMFEGAPLLLLHSTGRHSGKERVNPMMYLADGDRWIVFGSKGGHTAHPHWLHNLEANHEATIEVGTQTIPVKATVLREGPERDDLYARQVAAYPQFGEYRSSASADQRLGPGRSRRAGTVAIVKSPGDADASSSGVTGKDTVASSRARGEYGATIVAPVPLRDGSSITRPCRFALRNSSVTRSGRLAATIPVRRAAALRSSSAS